MTLKVEFKENLKEADVEFLKHKSAIFNVGQNG